MKVQCLKMKIQYYQKNWLPLNGREFAILNIQVFPYTLCQRLINKRTTFTCLSQYEDSKNPFYNSRSTIKNLKRVLHDKNVIFLLVNFIFFHFFLL